MKEWEPHLKIRLYDSESSAPARISIEFGFKDAAEQISRYIVLDIVTREQVCKEKTTRRLKENKDGRKKLRKDDPEVS
ncbi:hypothetical protein RvY_10242 [Ramazzottius varieornatus]|uniref:Uncharacterized protein n=1 Tax=Ramazzottius varieornatus TaxID=947166 RepID=A0A1D1VC55_RAMVA|nr:hypothetical protein RvY_10242 [Ramazzottius varieornatus]